MKNESATKRSQNISSVEFMQQLPCRKVYLMISKGLLPPSRCCFHPTLRLTTSANAKQKNKQSKNSTLIPTNPFYYSSALSAITKDLIGCCKRSQKWK